MLLINYLKNMSKWYYTRDEVGKFTGKLTLMKKISNHIKLKLWFLSKVCVLAWLVVGGIKVGQHVTPVNTVYADKEVPKEISALEIPILKKIIMCESGGKHYAKNGQVVTKANTNGTTDIGIAQINLYYWGKTATDMGLDLSNEKDNLEFAKWLFYQQGSSPWSASSKCWQ